MRALATLLLLKNKIQVALIHSLCGRSALEAASTLGGEDMLPFYSLLEGGREGKFYRVSAMTYLKPVVPSMTNVTHCPFYWMFCGPKFKGLVVHRRMLVFLLPLSLIHDSGSLNHNHQITIKRVVFCLIL